MRYKIAMALVPKKNLLDEKLVFIEYSNGNHLFPIIMLMNKC